MPLRCVTLALWPLQLICFVVEWTKSVRQENDNQIIQRQRQTGANRVKNGSVVYEDVRDATGDGDEGKSLKRRRQVVRDDDTSASEWPCSGRGTTNGTSWL